MTEIKHHLAFGAGLDAAPEARGVVAKRRGAARGFTLVELLVVVAIIALLAAMLLPALGRAKGQSRRIACLSNLRQMTFAAHMYVEDHTQFYPIAYYYAQDTSGNGKVYSYAWDLTTIGDASSQVVVPGILWQGLGASQIQQCPGYRGAANWNIDPFTGYNYNTSYIGHGEYESVPDPAKASELTKPARTALFGDGQYSGGANKFMRAPWPNAGDSSFSGRWAGTQGFRHLGRSNAAFCDGHADAMRNAYTNNVDGAAGVAPGTGFLSPDNSLYSVSDL